MRTRIFKSESNAASALVDAGFRYAGHLHEEIVGIEAQTTAWLPDHGVRRRWDAHTGQDTRAELAPLESGEWIVRELNPGD